MKDRSAFRSVLAACWLALGCEAEDARDIQARCELSNEPVRVVDTPSDAHQIGLLGEHALVSWMWYDAPIGEGVSWSSRWHSRDALTPAGDVIDMGGRSPGRRPMWVELNGALEGYVLADPERRPLGEIGTDDMVNWWTMPPPPAEPVIRNVNIPAPDNMFQYVVLEEISSSTGLAGTYPVVRQAASVLGGIGNVPVECGVSQAGATRLHLFGPARLEAQPILWGDDPCENAPIGLGSGKEVFAPWLVDLGSEIGLFYRPHGAAPQPVRYVRFRADGTVPGSDRIVGRTEFAHNMFGMIGGQQVRAVRLGSAIVFAEGLPPHAAWCTVLRVMNLDGSNARDAPFQLPCFEDRAIIDFKIEMGTTGDYAAIVWSERTRVDRVPPQGEDPFVTTGVTWWERVMFALLTAEGKLASAPIAVTPAEATALLPGPRTETNGPPPDDFRISAAIAPEGPTTAGDASTDHVVAWTDLRSDAPGVYATRVRCEPFRPPE